jgi:hypothetical protein
VCGGVWVQGRGAPDCDPEVFFDDGTVSTLTAQGFLHPGFG